MSLNTRSTQQIDIDTDTKQQPESKQTNHSSESQWPRHLGKMTIFSAAALLFLSRPLVGIAARESCYYLQGNVGFWQNPIRWALHGTTSLYKCEWMGYWGFNWIDSISWLGSKGGSLFASLAVLGGAYASWGNITDWLKQDETTTKDKDKLQELAQFISINQARGILPNNLHLSNTLLFSENRLEAENSNYSDNKSSLDYRSVALGG